MTKCLNCGEAELEQHNKREDLLICPLCWHKYDKAKVLQGEFVRVKTVPYRKETKKHEPRACVIIAVHRPGGVWAKPYFAVTWVYQGHAYSVPFQNAKDIPKQVDNAITSVRKLYGNVPIEKQWMKEEVTLTFRDEEEEPGTKDWKEMFVTKVSRGGSR